MDYTAMSAQPPRRQTLVLVTDQFQCERIIKAGRAIAGITHTQLRVFHICAEGRTSDPAALQYLYNSAKENGSVLEISYNSDFMGAITETLESTNTVNVITGQPGEEDSVLYTLWNRFPGIKFFTADADGRLDMVSTVRVAE